MKNSMLRNNIMRQRNKGDSTKTPNLLILFDILVMLLVMLSLIAPRQTVSVNMESSLTIPEVSIIAVSESNKDTLLYTNKEWQKISMEEEKKKFNDKVLIYSNYRDIYDRLPKLPEAYHIKSYVYGTLYDKITSRVFSKCIVKDECNQNIKLNITKDSHILIN